MNSLSTQRDVKVGESRDWGRICVALIVTAAVGGCAAVKPRTSGEVVKERSQARWNALVKGDVKAAYTFLSPGSRAVLSEEAFASSIRVGFWKSATVERVVCGSQDACEAQVTIEYEFRGTPLKTPLRESWIREGTQWWYLQR